MGFVYAAWDGGIHGFILDPAVLKPYRSKGIGKELMQKRILSAREFGHKKLYIESLPQFSKAVSMYVKQGFKKIGEPMGNSGHTSCDIWMMKELY